MIVDYSKDSVTAKCNVNGIIFPLSSYDRRKRKI